jgi:hypothetical protein
VEDVVDGEAGEAADGLGVGQHEAGSDAGAQRLACVGEDAAEQGEPVVLRDRLAGDAGWGRQAAEHAWDRRDCPAAGMMGHDE